MFADVMSFVSIINLGFFLSLSFVIFKKFGISKMHNRFIALIIFGFLWVLTRYLENVITGAFTFLIHLDFMLAILVAGFFASFSLHYPNQNKLLRTWWEILFFLPIIFLAAASFSDLFFHVKQYRELTYNLAQYFVYFGILSLYFFIIGIGSQILKFTRSSGIQRRQLGYIIFGSVLALSILLYDSIAYAIQGPRTIAMDRLFFNASLLFISLVAYAMARYRFLDIRFVIYRNLVRVISFLILLGVYLVLVLILKDSLVDSTKELNIVSLVVLGTLIVITVEPLRKYIYNFVDKRFELHDRQQERIQKQLQIVLKSQKSLSDLEQAIRKAFQETAKVDMVEYVDADDQKLIGKPALRAYLQSTGKVVICEELPYRLDEDVRFKQVNDEVKVGMATAYVPIGQNEIFVGCFVLGSRKGKVAYSAQEVSAMKLLQSQATDAFLNARLYKQAVERIKV